MVIDSSETRYFCNPLSDGRIMVVAIGTLDDLYYKSSKRPHWTFAFTEEYLDTIPGKRIVWFQKEFDFD